MKRLGDGIEVDGGMPKAAIRGLAHRSGCSYEEAKASCLAYREQHPAPPDHSTPELIEAAEPVAVLRHSDHQPKDDIVRQSSANWWDVPGGQRGDR